MKHKIKYVILLIFIGFVANLVLPKIIVKCVEGKYYEVGGDYYGAGGDEIIQIVSRENNTVDICWYRIGYDGESFVYYVRGLVEAVPASEFIIGTECYLTGLEGEKTQIGYKKFFKTMVLDGNIWTFEKIKSKRDIRKLEKEIEGLEDILGSIGTHIAFSEEYQEVQAVDVEDLITVFKQSYMSNN